MDRKTLLAVVISVVIIVGGMVLTPLLFPTKPTAQQAAPQGSAQAAQVANASWGAWSRVDPESDRATWRHPQSACRLSGTGMRAARS